MSLGFRDDQFGSRGTNRCPVVSIGKLRLDRGPLRWWLIVSGVLFVQFSARRSALGVVLLIAYQQISRRRSEISSRAWSMLTEIGRTIRRLILDG